jgi:hypothetical protein
MTDLFHISQQEIDSEKWDTARTMCSHYGYDIHEIAARLAKFRTERAEAHQQAVDALAAQMQARQHRPTRKERYLSFD